MNLSNSIMLLSSCFVLFASSCENNTGDKQPINHSDKGGSNEIFKISKKRFDGRFDSVEEWISLDSMKNIKSMNYAKLDLLCLEGSDSIEYNCRVFSTSNYDHSYLIIYDVDSIYHTLEMPIWSQGIGRFSYPDGIDEFAVRIVSTDFNFENATVNSNSINRQFKVLGPNRIIEEEYGLFNMNVNSEISRMSSVLFGRLKNNAN